MPLDDLKPAVTTTKTVVEAPVGEPAKVSVTTVTTSPLRELGYWTAGLVGAFISSAAGALGGALGGPLVDPMHFNIHDGLRNILELAGWTAIVPGVVSMAKYLNLNPVPKGWDHVTERRNGG